MKNQINENWMEEETVKSNNNGIEIHEIIQKRVTVLYIS